MQMSEQVFWLSDPTRNMADLSDGTRQGNHSSFCILIASGRSMMHVSCLRQMLLWSPEISEWPFSFFSVAAVGTLQPCAHIDEWTAIKPKAQVRRLVGLWRRVNSTGVWMQWRRFSGQKQSSRSLLVPLKALDATLPTLYIQRLLVW